MSCHVHKDVLSSFYTDWSVRRVGAKALYVLGSPVRNVKVQAVQSGEGVLHLTLQPGATCPNGEYPAGQLYQVQTVGDHGLSMMPLPGHLNRGFKKAADIDDLAAKLGITPFVKPRIIFRVDASLVQDSHHEYAKYVDVQFGQARVKIGADNLLGQGWTIEVDIDRSRGTFIKLKKADAFDDTMDIPSFTNWTEAIEHALSTGHLKSVQARPYKLVTLLLMPGIEELTRGSRQGSSYYCLSPVDGETEGTIVNLSIQSREGDGTLPLLVREPIPALIRHLGSNTYDVVKLEANSSYDGLLTDWAELPTIMGVPVKGGEKPLTEPEDTSIRVVRSA